MWSVPHFLRPPIVTPSHCPPLAPQIRQSGLTSQQPNTVEKYETEAVANGIDEEETDEELGLQLNPVWGKRISQTMSRMKKKKKTKHKY
jgi:hypothetical protein